MTIPDKYSTPHLHDCSNFLAGKTIFSTLDFEKAYNQVPMAPEDIEKTAVITPLGLFQFSYMTFGIKNASQTFRQFVDRAFGDLDFVFVYINDILIASTSIEEHERHLRIVFQRLREFGLRLTPTKCKFAVSEIEFLGYQIDSRGVSPTENEVKAILEFEKLDNIAQLRCFLGMVNFYRRWIPKAAEIQAPLNAFLLESQKNDTCPVP